jgi:hypothetical protein
MIKAETAPRISGEFPKGKSDEFIWLDGQPWTVAAEDDKRILKIEIFGPELENSRVKNLGGGTEMKSTDGTVVLRTLLLDDARYFSAQMRLFYP